MAHWSLPRVPRECCDVQSRSGSPHMAAPPWTARTKWTLHWYSQGGCDHLWTIGQSPESPGKAVISRAGVALLTWQPPPEQLEPSRPFIHIPRGTVIINGQSVILHSPQGRLWCQEPEWLSSHGSPPPDVLGNNRPSIDIPRGTLIINGPLVSLHSPQGRLWCPEPEWLSSHGSPLLTC